eukprot:2120027-Pleurochrysis_carterae.AAC.1
MSTAGKAGHGTRPVLLSSAWRRVSRSSERTTFARRRALPEGNRTGSSMMSIVISHRNSSGT